MILFLYLEIERVIEFTAQSKKTKSFNENSHPFTDKHALILQEHDSSFRFTFEDEASTKKER